MWFIFSRPVLIRHLWQLKTVVLCALVSKTFCSITVVKRVKVQAPDGIVLNFFFFVNDVETV
jgi:hypothetical protein